MLSYQHAYHAGNAADVQKHALLAWMIAAMADKPKAMTYIETHSGRGLYALDAPEAVKTGEAAGGVERLAARFAPDHPYRRCLDAVRAAHGPSAYPGSPVIAGLLLRVFDRIVLAELHPREHAALSEAMAPFEAEVRHEDGFAMARAVCPPTPRRGLLVIDPSYEVKEDYARLPGLIAELARKWPVGVIVLWYPLLTGAAHGPMLGALERAHPGALRHEVRFPPVREGHRMVGSGLFVINPPWRLDEEAARISALFDA
jgi:23S rRNA (adenine2030-N6)-methyltransferase